MDAKGPSLYTQAGPSIDMTHSMDEDSLVDGPLISADALHSAIRREFQPVPTQYHAGALSVLHVLFVVLSICVGVLCVLKFGQEEVCMNILRNVEGDSAIVFGKVGLWVLVLLFTRCVQHHHDRVRSRGYLRFYRETQGLKRLPLNIHSAGNVLLLILLAARLSQNIRTYLMLVVLGLELLVTVPCLIYYQVKVVQFNRARAAPDVSQEEISHNYSVTSTPTETGFRGGSSLEEVVEKQADLIEYLKQHNTSLSKRLLNLTAQH
ncbi:transmembrane protein 192 isoform X1 [Acanthochromis polyacanthus]|uniref:transmembrane protein 192 isoform X1 n=2 Tax=Acanthochromis polyacanthus TaxID=80966 RepID=UPI0022342AEB|nr:transmembrane protein 192 isoform X1 [Acanthochromis polyacanthus]